MPRGPFRTPHRHRAGDRGSRSLEHGAVLHAAAAVRSLDHPVLARPVRRRADHGVPRGRARRTWLARSRHDGERRLAGRRPLDHRHGDVHPRLTDDRRDQRRGSHCDAAVRRRGAGLSLVSRAARWQTLAGERGGTLRHRADCQQRACRERHQRHWPCLRDGAGDLGDDGRDAALPADLDGGRRRVVEFSRQFCQPAVRP